MSVLKCPEAGYYNIARRSKIVNEPMAIKPLGNEVRNETAENCKKCVYCDGYMPHNGWSAVLFSPIKAINVLCKIFGVVLILLGAVKILGYFTKDIFQLAFQFDFALGIISAILGIVLISENLIHGGVSVDMCGNICSD